MSNICKTVSLRTRKIKDGHMLSYYLDYYPGYRDESTMKVIRHESLGIYIYAKPKNQTEQKYNLSLTARAEAIRCRRFEAIVNERYDFFDKEKMKGDFLAYFKKLADKKNSKWQHVYMHFRTFTQGKCTFGEINVDLCNRFREYLLIAPQGLHKNRILHINSAANYWSTFRASIHTTYRDHKKKENPNGFLERIETIPTDKEHLSQDEVIRLASTKSRDTVQITLPVYTTDLKNQYQSLCDIAILFISFSNSSKQINTDPKYFSGTLYVVAAKYRIVMLCSLHSLCFNSSLCF